MYSCCEAQVLEVQHLRQRRRIPIFTKEILEIYWGILWGIFTMFNVKHIKHKHLDLRARVILPKPNHMKGKKEKHRDYWTEVIKSQNEMETCHPKQRVHCGSLGLDSVSQRLSQTWGEQWLSKDWVSATWQWKLADTDRPGWPEWRGYVLTVTREIDPPRRERESCCRLAARYVATCNEHDSTLPLLVINLIKSLSFG